MALGVTSITAQLVLLREFLTLAHGNELAIGLFLGCWTALTGIGALLGARKRSLPALLLALAALPLALAAAMQMLLPRIFGPGVMAGLPELFLAAGAVMAPFCLLSGLAFALFLRGCRDEAGQGFAGRMYAAESAGSAAAALLYACAGPLLLTSLCLLALLFAANALLAALLFMRSGHRISAAAALAAAAAVVAAAFAGAPDLLLNAARYPGQKLTELVETPQGRLTVTRQDGQDNLFENGTLLFSRGDVAAAEECVHSALAQRTRPRSVLFVGGCSAALFREAAKYPVRRIVCVEQNAWLLDLLQRADSAFLGTSAVAMREDPRRFVRNANERFDAVIITTADPSTLAGNRFYTREFFRDLRRVLAPGGVVSVPMLSDADYYGPEARELLAVMKATLAASFPRSRIVPGLRNRILASDSALSVAIPSLVAQRGIATVAVNSSYIDEDDLRARSEALERGIPASAALNTDLRPRAAYLQARYWLAQFDPGAWVLTVAVAGLLLLLARSRSLVELSAGVAGFGSAALEIVLLLVVQMLAGAAMLLLGLLVAVFMAGLALGSRLRMAARHDAASMLAAAQAAMGAIALALPLLLSAAADGALGAVPVVAACAAALFTAAACAGVAYTAATRALAGDEARQGSRLYANDLAGAALGALLSASLLIPLLGVATVCCITGGLHLCCAALLRLRRRAILA